MAQHLDFIFGVNGSREEILCYWPADPIFPLIQKFVETELWRLILRVTHELQILNEPIANALVNNTGKWSLGAHVLWAQRQLKPRPCRSAAEAETSVLKR